MRHSDKALLAFGLVVVSSIIFLDRQLGKNRDARTAEKVQQYHFDKKAGIVVKDLPGKAVDVSVNRGGSKVAALEDGSVWESHIFNSWRCISKAPESSSDE